MLPIRDWINPLPQLKLRNKSVPGVFAEGKPLNFPSMIRHEIMKCTNDRDAQWLQSLGRPETLRPYDIRFHSFDYFGKAFRKGPDIFLWPGHRRNIRLNNFKGVFPNKLSSGDDTDKIYMGMVESPSQIFYTCLNTAI